VNPSPWCFTLDQVRTVFQSQQGWEVVFTSIASPALTPDETVPPIMPINQSKVTTIVGEIQNPCGTR